MILPASEYWALEGYLPTGELKPVDARLDFRKGQPMTGLKLDDVLTGLAFDGDRCVCRLVDDDLEGRVPAGLRPALPRAGRLHPAVRRRDVIAVEPYTQTTDAINLQARGVDAGLRVLEHGAVGDDDDHDGDGRLSATSASRAPDFDGMGMVGRGSSALIMDSPIDPNRLASRRPLRLAEPLRWELGHGAARSRRTERPPGPPARPAPAGGRDLPGDRLSRVRAPSGGPPAARLAARARRRPTCWPAAVRAGRQGPGREADLRAPAGQRPLSPHEAAGSALGRRHGLPALGQHPRPALALDPNSPDAEAFMALQAENQRLKVEIEQAWDEAGLPTFPRYLRDYLGRASRRAPSRTGPRSESATGRGLASSARACSAGWLGR